MNTMTRLPRKRLLVAERRGEAFGYRPAFSREAFVDHFVSEATEHLLLNFRGAARSRLRRVTDRGPAGTTPAVRGSFFDQPMGMMSGVGQMGGSW